MGVPVRTTMQMRLQISAAAATVLVFAHALIAFADATLSSSSSLQALALDKVLADAAPVFGPFASTVSYASTARWMGKYPDSTPLADLNIPGAHDAATWNYSDATQAALVHVTDVGGATLNSAAVYRCQEQSIASLLDAGVRFFDLRVAFDVVNSTLVFWHTAALQSQTATMEDVLFGFYHWLDTHPTETVLLSVMRESSTKLYSPKTVDEQLAIYNALTSPAAKQYLLQTRGALGTLGDARGRIVLLRRFALDLLDSAYDASLPGLYVNPALWLDNNANITLVYNSSTGATAYIEDFYETSDESYEANIEDKFNATVAHLAFAAATPVGTGALFITFTSAEHDFGNPAVMPIDMALGAGETATPAGGVNNRLATYLPSLSGKRLGIVIFDFADSPSDLLPTFLGLRPPNVTSLW
ncbi:hypothetical protein HK405_003279 [Cladochytrium tenue]|nr:hypothetical protein HK405_003279 [Cladochytrium tenue]